MSKTSFGVTIKRLRKNKNITMQQLAEEVGVSKSAVSMWENRGVIPREDVLRKISSIYKISIDALLGNTVQDAQSTQSRKLSYIQRNLGKLDEEELNKAESVLKLVFEDIFSDEEEDIDDDL